MRSIISVIHRIVSFVCFFGTVLLLFMMLLTVTDILGRGMFNLPIPGAYELTEYLLVVLILGGIAYTQQVKQHIRVDFLVTKLSRRGRYALDIIFAFIGLVFMGLVVWQGLLGGVYAVGAGTVSDTLSVPDYIFQFFIPFGAFLFALEYIIRIIELIKYRADGQSEMIN